jgi:uncharacterized protein
VTAYLVDTNVFLYARGRDHPYREPCRGVLRAAQHGLLALEGSVELVQEFAHVLLRRGHDRRMALEEAAEVRAQCVLHDFDDEVLVGALRLLHRHAELGVRDAIHAATAVHVGLDRIVSVDAAFDAVTEVRRVDPGDLATRLHVPLDQD